MKKFVTCIFLTLLTLPTFAQDAAKAKKLLDEVSSKAKSYKNIKIDFKTLLLHN